MPMRPSPSPTTVNAAKPRIRPPFTTLVTRLIEIIFSFNPSPRSSCCCDWRELERCCAISRIPCSELETALAGSVGQRFHAAMKAKARTVERDGFDTRRLRALRDALADHRRSRLVAAVLQILAHVGFERRRADDHLVAGRSDDLRIDVAVRAADDEARGALLGNADARLSRAANSSFLLVHQSLRRKVKPYFSPLKLPSNRGQSPTIAGGKFVADLLLLRFFDLDAFVDVTNAFALVGLGRAIRADLRRNLANLLLVDALDDDFRLHGRLHRYALRHRVHDWMRETQRKVDLVARCLRAVTDPDERQLFLEALRDALHHVRDECAQRSL